MIMKQIGKFAVPELVDILKHTPNLEKLYNRVDQHPEIVSFKGNNKKPYVGLMVPRPKKQSEMKDYLKEVIQFEDKLGIK